MTANVLVTGSNGIQTTARAFIDGGSSVTLISNQLKTALALKPTGQHMSIDGVAGFVGETQHPVVKVTLSSPQDKKWEKQITAIAMPKVIRDLPLKDASVTLGMPHLQNLKLADPLYHKVGPVDMLLGLDVFPYIFRTGKEEGPPNTPVAWDTVFGWTVLGMYSATSCKDAISAPALIADPLTAQTTGGSLLSHLWRPEEPPRPKLTEQPTEEERVEAQLTQIHQDYNEYQSPGAKLVDLIFQAEDQRILESTMQPKEEEKVAAQVTQAQPILIEKRRFQVALTKTSEDPVLEESRGQANEEAFVNMNEWSKSRPAIEECVLLKHTVATSPPDEDSSPSSSQAFQDLASSFNHSQTLAILPKQSQNNLKQNVLKTATAKPQENFTDQKLLESRRDESTTQVNVSSSCTSNERGMAVDIAGTIDASGWLSYFILEMKTLYGSCWKQKIGWEQAIPQKKLNNCKTRSKDKPLLTDIKLPRHFYLGKREIEVTLHGFSNTNEKASSAVECLRAAHESGPQTSTLVCFKPTVAFLDLKYILKLELDGAHPLTKILKEVSSTLGITTSHTMAPADNTSVLTLPISTTQKPAGSNIMSFTEQKQILHHLPLWHDPLRLEKEPLARTTKIKHNDETSNPHQQNFLQVVAAVLPSPAQSFKTCSNFWTQIFLVLCWITSFLSRARRKILPSSEVLVEKENAADLTLLEHSRQRAFNQHLAQLKTFLPQLLCYILSVLALQPEIDNKGLPSIGGSLSQANLKASTSQFPYKHLSFSAFQPEIDKRGLLSIEGRQRKAKLRKKQKHSEILRATRSNNLLIQYNLKLMQAGPTLSLLHSCSQFFIPSSRRLAREDCKTYQSNRDSLRLYMYNERKSSPCRAGACLHSRPLGVIASHLVSGMTPLAPGHYQVGRALNIYPTAKIYFYPEDRFLQPKPEKWVDKTDYLSKLKRRTTVSRRPVAKLSMLLAADEQPTYNLSTEDSGTTFQPPPAC